MHVRRPLQDGLLQPHLLALHKELVQRNHSRAAAIPVQQPDDWYCDLLSSSAVTYAGLIVSFVCVHVFTHESEKVLRLGTV